MLDSVRSFFAKTLLALSKLDLLSRLYTRSAKTLCTRSANMPAVDAAIGHNYFEFIPLIVCA